MTVVLEVGQIWRTEDGYLWRIAHVTDEKVWVRPGYGRAAREAAPSEVNPAWFELWTLDREPVTPAPRRLAR